MFLNTMMEAQLPFIKAVEDYIGWMKLSIRKGMCHTLPSEGLLAAPFAVEDTDNKMFLEGCYGVSMQ
jgi:hypothetical protein